MRPWFSWCCVGLLTVGLTGCGGSAAPAKPMGKLTGMLLIDGKPPGGECELNFFDASKGAGGLARTNAEGAFTMTDGMPTGSYKVYVTPKEPEPTEPGVARPKPATAIPRKYQSVDTTDLVAEVKEGDNAPLALNLKK